ncbi:hypothetical protein JUJ52_02705 [Virgibacillus sp. AGTR]|uniref:hypothetical protein n=1 Tax=unclassified Virgibacillus TaxID=2620237 RepID=UPI000426306E|nr:MULTISPECIES: hypothetical protein [Bacillaceae]MCC2248870.1 hypothetical protein [Virgibacillus sp. AGTR]MDY7044029.1 hypothetical protein [Virgibacillus sp. M23]
MADQAKEVEDMKEFMTVLMDVKVSLAEQSGKLDSLLDMKDKINETYDIAKGAYNRSKENEKDIDDLKKGISSTASKEDVERIVKQRENMFKNLPSWLALAISIAVFLLTYLAN